MSGQCFMDPGSEMRDCWEDPSPSCLEPEHSVNSSHLRADVSSANTSRGGAQGSKGVEVVGKDPRSGCREALFSNLPLSCKAGRKLHPGRWVGWRFKSDLKTTGVRISREARPS